MKINLRFFNLLFSVSLLFAGCFNPNQIPVSTNTAFPIQTNSTQPATRFVITETAQNPNDSPKHLGPGEREIDASQLRIEVIKRVVLSPDGNTLAVSGSNGVFLYDSNSLKYKASMSILAYGLAFHPDGHILALVHDGIVQFWDMDLGELHTFAGSTRSSSGSAVGRISFSPDGNYIGFHTTGVCDGVDSKFEVRDVSSGEIVIQRETCAHWVPPVFAFDRDASHLILGYMDDTLPADSPRYYVEVIDVASGTSILNLPHVQVIDASVNGQMVAIYDTLDPYAEKKNTWILDLNSNERLLEIRYPESFISFSPDGTHFLAKNNEEVSLRDIGTGQVVCELKELENIQVAFNWDGNQVVLWNSQTILLFDIKKCISQ